MTTQIHFILDRSGSMSDGLEDYIGGFNTFVNTQKNQKDDNATMSLYQFDHEYQIIYANLQMKDVKELNKETFVPRGRTALFDAIGETMESIAPEENTSIIIVVLTDGMENGSSEFTGKRISKMIEKKKELGWEFIYLGANQDAILEGGKIGINHQSSLTFQQDKEGIQECFRSLSNAVSAYRNTPMKERKTKGVRFDETKSQ